MFKREEQIEKLSRAVTWDVVIIGGGATGLGTAVDAASRGYKVLLLEAYDFAKGTSSRSTKLIHGGVRYLAQGNIKLVYEALHERGLLLKNAPHLVKKQSFIIPCYTWWEKTEYIIGLKIYDWLSGRLSLGASRVLTATETSGRLPSVREKELAGGIEYFDARFDDARLAINLAQTATEQGATVLNYCPVSGLLKQAGKVSGVIVTDMESGKEYTVKSRSVVNATGVFVDDILRMDKGHTKNTVQPSQGIHLVVSRSFLQADSAVMIPKTTDGRVLFALPWHDHVLLGTTDTPLSSGSFEPVATAKEVDFILENVRHYFKNPPLKKDVQSVFAGLRPLVAQGSHTSITKEIARDHKLIVSPSGLLTITGGKWTTYRRMAKHAVDEVTKIAGLPPMPCVTASLKIHGSGTAGDKEEQLSTYGSDAENIEELMRQRPSLRNRLASSFAYTEAEVVWAIRSEMARTVEDVLARRLRLLFLDVKAALQAAPRVAELLQAELRKDDQWKSDQLRQFHSLARNYLLDEKGGVPL